MRYTDNNGDIHWNRILELEEILEIPWFNKWLENNSVSRTVHGVERWQGLFSFSPLDTTTKLALFQDWLIWLLNDFGASWIMLLLVPKVLRV